MLLAAVKPLHIGRLERYGTLYGWIKRPLPEKRSAGMLHFRRCLIDSSYCWPHSGIHYRVTYTFYHVSCNCAVVLNFEYSARDFRKGSSGSWRCLQKGQKKHWHLPNVAHWWRVLGGGLSRARRLPADVACAVHSAPLPRSGRVWCRVYSAQRLETSQQNMLPCVPAVPSAMWSFIHSCRESHRGTADTSTKGLFVLGTEFL